MIDFHPAASDEAEDAHNWYGKRSPIAAARFRDELDEAVAENETRPECGAPYLHGTRCYIMRRFPYLVVYHLAGHTIQVVAVAHGRRRPGYWKARKF